MKKAVGRVVRMRMSLMLVFVTSGLMWWALIDGVRALLFAT